MDQHKKKLTTFLDQLLGLMSNKNNEYDFYNYRSYFLNDNLLKMLCMVDFDNDDFLYEKIVTSVGKIVDMYDKIITATFKKERNYEVLLENIKDIKQQIYLYSLINEKIVSDTRFKKSINITREKIQIQMQDKSIEKDTNVMDDLCKVVNNNSGLDVIKNNIKSDNQDEKAENFIKRLFFIISNTKHINEADKRNPKKWLTSKLKHVGEVGEIRITFNEICEACKLFVLNTNGTSKYFSENKLAEQFYDFDDDCGGTIDYDEFSTWITGGVSVTHTTQPESTTTPTITRTSFNELMEGISDTQKFECLNRYKTEFYTEIQELKQYIKNNSELKKYSDKTKDKKAQTHAQSQVNKSVEEATKKLDDLENSPENKEISKEIIIISNTIMKNKFESIKTGNKYVEIYNLYIELKKALGEQFNPEKIKINKTSYNNIKDELSNLDEIFEVEKNFKTPYYIQYIHF